MVFILLGLLIGVSWLMFRENLRVRRMRLFLNYFLTCNDFKSNTDRDVQTV